MLNTITNIDRDSPARGKVKIGDELLSITVSYTHLDVYKRQS